MKLYKKIILSALACLPMTACNDWLDINVDPNSPTAESAQIQTRLPWCQFYMNSAYEFAGSRTIYACGAYTATSRTSRDGCSAQWEPTISLVTTPYQWFFVGCGSNLEDLYTKSMAAGAYHYAGAAKVLRAYGFMLMTDLYGEMPYTEALGVNTVPTYDTGKTIFLGCLGEIDEAIELLQKAQNDGTPALALGDSWNGGDANKWLKMAYLLKARWCNNLSKKGTGSYLDGKYDTTTILDCISKAMSSNADNTLVTHLDANSSTHDVLGWDEPVDYAPLFSVQGMSRSYRVTKMLTDNLENFDDKGVEDPRADALIPWAKSKELVMNTETNRMQWSSCWRRSAGVDMSTNIRMNGGPYGLSFNEKNEAITVNGRTVGPLAWYCKTDNAERWGDTIYVHMMSGAKGYYGTQDLLSRMGDNVAGSETTSNFYLRPSSPNYIATYHEACFIKAEVLFKQGNKGEAFIAYKNGIKASIDLMNEKLNAWVAEDASLKTVPAFMPMSQTKIDNFLNNAIGTQADLTLAKIMTQKYIAMLYSVQIWNDMRRYDYASSVFMHWNIPFEYHTNAGSLKCIPEGSMWRRWRQCSHEYKYNSKNLQAIGAQVPGANMSEDVDSWNQDDKAWSINVWWDSDQE